ncbi:MAG: hypothetical protein MUC76_15015 [Spirochaetes bacterium]|jgi:hypothetical protein|nr:hypothetical protein [Spirochaetota bacterium]
MIAFVKPALALAVLVSLAVLPLSLPVIVATLLLFALIVYASRTRLAEMLVRNTLVGLFALFFISMAAISALLRGDMPTLHVAELGGRIVLVFNAVYLGGRWIGQTGVIRLVDSLPSERLRLFLILIVKQAHSILAANRMVIDQLRSRLDMTKRDRLLIARFYVQNMVYGELRSYRHLQAALYTRLPGRLSIYHRPLVFKAADALIGGAALVCAAAAFLSWWSGK